MKIEIAPESGRKIKLYIPLWESLAGIGAKVMCGGMNKWLSYADIDDIEIGIEENASNMPSKKELKGFLKESISILKNHKGLELVEVEDHDGDCIKITL